MVPEPTISQTVQPSESGTDIPEPSILPSTVQPSESATDIPEPSVLPTKIQPSGPAPGAPQPTHPSEEELQHLIKAVQNITIEIRGGLFAFREQLPAESAKYSWRVVFYSTTRLKYRIEPSEPSDHGRVVTKVEDQLVYGRVVDSKPAGNWNGTRLVVDNGRLEQFEIKHKTVTKIGPVSQDAAPGRPREILKCAGTDSCSAKACQGNECDANLEVKYQSPTPVNSSAFKFSEVVTIKLSTFVPCQVPHECNCVRKCTEDDECAVEKPAERQPSASISREQVRPNTVSAVINNNINIGQTPSGGKAPVEQDGSNPSSLAQQAADEEEEDAEDCDQTPEQQPQDGPQEAPKSDGIPPASPKQAPSGPNQGPQNDGQGPAAPQKPEAPKQGPQNDGKRPSAPAQAPSAPKQGPQNDGKRPSAPQEPAAPAQAPSAPKQGPQNDGKQPSAPQKPAAPKEAPSAPKQGPQNDGKGPAAPQMPDAPEQGSQNDGQQPAARPKNAPANARLEVETTESVTVETRPMDQPPAAQPAGDSPGTDSNRRQRLSTPPRANNTRGGAIAQPITVSAGSVCTVVVGNVFVAIAAMALLL